MSVKNIYFKKTKNTFSQIFEQIDGKNKLGRLVLQRNFELLSSYFGQIFVKKS